MRRDNIEVVRGIFERFAAGDFTAPLDVLDPLALFVLPRDFPDAGAYLGLEQIAEYTRALLEPWRRFTIEAEEITAAGDSVLVAACQRGIGGESGAAAEFRYFQVWSFRGDKVIRIESFRERADAAEAAGPAS